MIELRWIDRAVSSISGPQTVRVLQFRQLLSDAYMLGVQTQADADIAEKCQSWQDVPLHKEL